MRWSRAEDRAFLATLPPEAPALRDMPELWPDLAWYLEAFNELKWDRAVGFGAIGYIPTPAIVRWGEANGIEDLALLVRHLHALDIVYVADCVEKQKRDADRAQKQREGAGGAGEP